MRSWRSVDIGKILNIGRLGSYHKERGAFLPNAAKRRKRLGDNRLLTYLVTCGAPAKGTLCTTPRVWVGPRRILRRSGEWHSEVAGTVEAHLSPLAGSDGQVRSWDHDSEHQIEGLDDG